MTDQVVKTPKVKKVLENVAVQSPGATRKINPPASPSSPFTKIAMTQDIRRVSSLVDAGVFDEDKNIGK